MEPPDWFSNEHRPMPRVVAQGAPGVFACASCHLVSGLGHPESANLAGLSVAYIERQLSDFKSGQRFALGMPKIARNLSDADGKEAASWLSQLPLRAWQKVVETDRVPKTFVDRHLMRLPLSGSGDEPIGDRIIEIPQDAALAKSRDPYSGFIAYVPKGSIEKGRKLVTTGGNGKTFECAICHGPALSGLGEVPLIAGHDPVYLFRQLYAFKHGLRNGSLSPLMEQVVANLSLNDMLDVAAYLGSLSPPAQAGEAAATETQRDETRPLGSE
jgi:cytochrome c553